jgi:hypothetical protein
MPSGTSQTGRKTEINQRFSHSGHCRSSLIKVDGSFFMGQSGTLCGTLCDNLARRKKISGRVEKLARFLL